MDKGCITSVVLAISVGSLLYRPITYDYAQLRSSNALLTLDALSLATSFWYNAPCLLTKTQALRVACSFLIPTNNRITHAMTPSSELEMACLELILQTLSHMVHTNISLANEVGKGNQNLRFPRA